MQAYNPFVVLAPTRASGRFHFTREHWQTDASHRVSHPTTLDSYNDNTWIFATDRFYH